MHLESSEADVRDANHSLSSVIGIITGQSELGGVRGLSGTLRLGDFPRLEGKIPSPTQSFFSTCDK